MEHLISWARSGLEALGGSSILQVCMIAALGLGLFYWALGLGLRSIRRAVLPALLLIVALAVLRLTLPELFCGVRWPTPIADLCRR